MLSQDLAIMLDTWTTVKFLSEEHYRLKDQHKEIAKILTNGYYRQQKASATTLEKKKGRCKMLDKFIACLI